MAINNNDHWLLPSFPDLGLSVQSFKKERIVKTANFPNPVKGITSPIDQSNMVGHRYELEALMTSVEMKSFQSMYFRYGTNRPMLWSPGGKETEVNTYHYITTMTNSQVAFSLGDILIVEAGLGIQLRSWNGTTEVTTELGTDVFSLTDEYAGIVELTVSGSRHVYASYERFMHVCFVSDEMTFEPMANGYYSVKFSLREVNS